MFSLFSRIFTFLWFTLFLEITVWWVIVSHLAAQDLTFTAWKSGCEKVLELECLDAPCCEWGRWVWPSKNFLRPWHITVLNLMALLNVTLVEFRPKILPLWRTLSQEPEMDKKLTTSLSFLRSIFRSWAYSFVHNCTASISISCLPEGSGRTDIQRF